MITEAFSNLNHSRILWLQQGQIALDVSDASCACSAQSLMWKSCKFCCNYIKGYLKRSEIVISQMSAKLKIGISIFVWIWRNKSILSKMGHNTHHISQFILRLAYCTDSRFCILKKNYESEKSARHKIVSKLGINC